MISFVILPVSDIGKYMSCKIIHFGQVSKNIEMLGVSLKEIVIPGCGWQ